MPPVETSPSFGKSLFVLGGARSGKSRHAQAIAEAAAATSAGPLVYIATAQAFDEEMRDRIARHQDDRDTRWQTVEAPIDLAAALRHRQAALAAAARYCSSQWMS